MTRVRLRVDLHAARGPEAARLKQRRATVRRAHALPEALDGMWPGSLVCSHFRCGKPTCHCAHDAGHPKWSLTYTVAGQKRMLHIPTALVADIRARVAAGRAFQDAVREVLTTNVALFALARQQRRKRSG
jgi:hypothetical protein